jgi:hypothetical protein
LPLRAHAVLYPVVGLELHVGSNPTPSTREIKIIGFSAYAVAQA